MFETTFEKPFEKVAPRFDTTFNKHFRPGIDTNGGEVAAVVFDPSEARCATTF